MSDGLQEQLTDMCNSLGKIANAITSEDATPVQDAGGNFVGSLTDAVCWITSGLFRLAESLDTFSEVYREVHRKG